MKKLILSLIVLLSVLLTSCLSQHEKQIQEQKNIKYKIFDNTGGSWETTDYNLNYTNAIEFKIKDGTLVRIHGNYTIEQIK